VEVIQFEVLHRLLNVHGLSLDDIDGMRVLPALRESNRFGLIYQMTQRCVRAFVRDAESTPPFAKSMYAFRDELFWTGMTADIPTTADGPLRRGINPREHEPGIDDLRRRIESVVPYFCANPGCVHAFCPLHGRSSSTSYRFVRLMTIQWRRSLPSRRLYPELRAMIIQKNRPAGRCALGKSTPIFRLHPCVISAPDLAHMTFRRIVSNGGIRK
jgi:hypothetical protein